MGEITPLSDEHSKSEGVAGEPASPDDQQRVSGIQEQQAIAAAMMIGEQMRRDQRAGVYFYAQRISLFVSGLAFMAMIMLYAYSRLSRGEFNPLIGMIFLGLIMAGGASVSYWASTEMRRAKED